MTGDVVIRTFIDGREVSRSDVQRWEARRAKAVLAKLDSRLGRRAVAEILPGVDLDTVTGAGLDAQREVLCALKLGLGHAGIYAMLRHELAMSERVARIAVAGSRGRKAYSTTRLVVDGVSAVQFGAWFDGLTATNDEEAMVRACPDHYLLRGLPDGRQEVVETTGGSPTPTWFLVDYAAAGSVSVPVKPEYPVQIAGLAVLDDGLVIGGVRHQFRDRDGAMEALLAVEFPGLFPSHMVAAHRWHLAAEFGNWIIAAGAASPAG
ncbi:hypothetical protein [Mycobacterium sp. DL99]|uniref:hypothetical protein n=1 Tax=Mycobacterium sp. DL99 TaxID=2528957 RepID=UPI001080407D|nr:hypothetical protein [Mycobacterium sp. DL99]